MLRGIEFYRGRLIAYSLGNFLTYRGFNLDGPLGVTGVLQLEFAARPAGFAARVSCRCCSARERARRPIRSGTALRPGAAALRRGLRAPPRGDQRQSGTMAVATSARPARRRLPLGSSHSPY